MTRWIVRCLLLVAALYVGPEAWGQSDPQAAEDKRALDRLEQEYQAFAAALAKGLPERSGVKVKPGPPVKERLRRPDPKLLENKFVAHLQLRIAGVDPSDAASILKLQARMRIYQSPDLYRAELPSEFGSKGIDNSRIFYPENTSGLPNDKTVPVHFQWLVERSPADSRPEEQLVTYLTSQDCARDIRRSWSTVTVDGVETRDPLFLIFAPTEQQAADRALAIVRLYDAGFSRPTQQYLLGECQQKIESARGQYAKAAPMVAAIAAEGEKLSKPSEISADILKELKAQKVMVAVELAGLNARVKACDAMLQDPQKLGPNALQSVGDMKVKAEIERVGIKEKLDAINGFIAEGDARDDARRKHIELRMRSSTLREQAQGNVRGATLYVELLHLFAPFEIPDNQITVAPLEWTE